MNRHIIMSLLTLLPMASMANKIEVVVHRGANALAPENTIVSADSALKYGAAWIEVDVRPKIVKGNRKIGRWSVVLSTVSWDTNTHNRNHA